MASEKGNPGAARTPASPPGSTPPDSSSDPKLDRLAQSRIGDQLRSMYDELLVQPVPDRFKDLLEKLDVGSDRKLKS